jgi:hypothetical protein
MYVEPHFGHFTGDSSTGDLFTDIGTRCVPNLPQVPIPMMSPLDSEGSRHPVPIQSARVFRLIPPPLVGA